MLSRPGIVLYRESHVTFTFFLSWSYISRQLVMLLIDPYSSVVNSHTTDYIICLMAFFIRLVPVSASRMVKLSGMNFIL